MMDLRYLPLLALLGAAAWPAAAHAADQPAASPRPAASAADLEFFETKVRPLLAEHCYECHGASKQKSGLRWDHIDYILTGGERGPALVPGEPERSRLLHAVSYADKDLRMPPKAKLAEDQVAVLREWVKRSAPWPDEPVPQGGVKKETFDIDARRAEHWSWRPIDAPEPPGVKQADWPINDIDRFILARLEAKGLRPALDADRRTLIRRLSYDLIGLPPTPAEVDAFVHDTSADAYEKLVDRLLASPGFGERWGRHWLDLMRYAESYGHEFDYNIPHAWKYRDYVIRALNADVPYDQLVREHIAGDLLPEPRRHPETGVDESIAATGFWYLHEQTHAPTDVNQHEADRIDNQLDVFSKTFLGLTVACARCHDHKFDAISAADYYALAGFLQSSRQQEAYRDPHGRIAEAVGRAQAVREEADAAIAATGNAPPMPPRIQVDAEEAKTRTPVADFNGPSWDGWYTTGHAWGAAPTQPGQWDTLTGDARAVRPGLAHSGLNGPKAQGTLRSPTFTITQPVIHVRVAGHGTVRLIVDGYTMMSYNGLLFGGTKFEVKHGDGFKWATLGGDVSMYVGHKAYLEFIDDDNGWLAIDEIWQGGLGERRLNDEPLAVEPIAGADAAAFAPFKQRFDEAANAIPGPDRVLAMTDGDGENTYVHIRGSHKSVGPTVPRRLLTALGGEQAEPLSADAGSGRLRLAQRMLDDSNPYTARVRVNRVWHHLFGRGIVPTVDNFGVLGQEPTHPGLLDHLAQRFRTDLGWSQKALIRYVVTSRTYRMSSRPADPEAERADPANLLLHRQRVRRLEGEVIRDAILSISGRLDPALYGPSVPVHLTPFMEGRGRPKGGPLDGDGRRSIYLSVRRNFLAPMFLAFDTPAPFSTVGRRSVSNVPAQALILMNDPFVVQQAEAWARRVMAEQSVPGERIKHMYLEAFARPVTLREAAAAQEFVRTQGETYGLPAEKAAGDVRVWADLAHVLMNTKEFIVVH